MPTIKAFRMDGLGNKFVIVDRRKDFVNISKEKIIHLGNLESFHRDIGFDQIIFIEKEVDKAIDDVKDDIKKHEKPPDQDIEPP